MEEFCIVKDDELGTNDYDTNSKSALSNDKVTGKDGNIRSSRNDGRLSVEDAVLVFLGKQKLEVLAS